METDFAVVLFTQGLDLFVFPEQVDNPVLWLTTIPLTAMAIAVFISSMIIGYSVRAFSSD